MNTGDLLAGKYRVQRVLGQGGMGRVVAAVHEALEQPVAIKLLRPEALAHAEAVARFLREARAAVKLRSEHVGRVLDVGTLATGEPYMVMEYLEGADLASLLDRQGRLPPAVAVEYVLQACEAIAEAHSHGIVHRDIKPANLFLTWRADGSPLIKVLDFGIAKAAPGGTTVDITSTEAVLGSPGYMSPEQLRSARAVDARTDIWSLGVVLYELLSDRRPFDGTTFSEVCIQIATDPMPALSPSEAPPDLAGVVARCLAKEPDARFPHVAALAAALEPFASPRSRGAAEAIARVLRVAPHPVVASSAAAAGPPTTLSGASGTMRSLSGAVLGRGRGRAIAIATAITAVVAIAATVLLSLLSRHPAKALPAAGAAAAVEARPLAAIDAAPTAAVAHHPAAAPDAHLGATASARAKKPAKRPATGAKAAPIGRAASAAKAAKRARSRRHSSHSRRRRTGAHRRRASAGKHRRHTSASSRAAGGLNLDSRE